MLSGLSLRSSDATMPDSTVTTESGEILTTILLAQSGFKGDASLEKTEATRIPSVIALGKESKIYKILK